MEIFGYFILIIFAIVGLGALVLFALPFIIANIKTSSYKIKKEIEVTKIDIDAKAEAKKIRNEKLREKENELKDKKILLKINKLQSKINSVDKDLEIQESLKIIEPEEKEEKVEEVIKETKQEVTEEVKEKVIDSPEQNNDSDKE